MSESRSDIREGEVATGTLIGGLSSNPLNVEINGQIFTGKTVAEFYENVLKYFVDSGYIGKIELPIPTGTKRYLIAKEPVHQTGTDFRVRVSYNGYHMEAHKSYDTALRDLTKLIEKSGLTMKVLNGS